jgi:hypothetical protein
VKKKIWWLGVLAVVLIAAYFAASPPAAAPQLRGAAAAPPAQADLTPFAAIIGVVLLVVLSALAWYIPTEFAWKKK